MSVLLQISDPHFGTEQPPVVEALLALAQATEPCLVVISGDITQRARRAQFAAAREFVRRLPAPHVLCIPGNHDIPLFNLAARALTPYANYCEAFGDQLEPCWSDQDFCVIGVNTTRPARRKDGEVSLEQIERVAARLRSADPEQLRIVVVHQPVHVVRDIDQKNLLHGHREAVRAWATAGADLIMGGHIHLPYVRPLADGEAELPRRVWAVQAGTALSSRVRGSIPNSVNVVRHDAAQSTCCVERWDYDAELQRFTEKCVEHLPLDRQTALPTG